MGEFEEFKVTMAGAMDSVVNPGDRDILQKLISFENEEEAQAYLLGHVDEIADPVIREAIVKQVLDGMEEYEDGVKEGGHLFDAALEDVKTMKDVLGEAELTRGGPRLICGFINKQFGKSHSVELITAIFDALKIPYLSERQ